MTTTTNAQTDEGRKVDGAHDWFVNVLHNLVAGDAVDDLAEAMDGDRETAATLWTRFTNLTSRAQAYLQTLAGEDALRTWLESILIYGSEYDCLQLRRDRAGAYYAYYPPTDRVVRWTRRAAGGWDEEVLPIGANVVDLAAEVGTSDLPADLAELLRRDATGDYASLFSEGVQA